MSEVKIGEIQVVDKSLADIIEEKSGDDIVKQQAPDNTVQGCKGWILLDNTFWDAFRPDDKNFPINCRVLVYRHESGSDYTLVDDFNIEYTKISLNTNFVSGEDPSEAMESGNPKIILGGANGYEADRHYAVGVIPLLASRQDTIFTDRFRVSDEAFHSITDSVVNLSNGINSKHKNWTRIYDKNGSTQDDVSVTEDQIISPFHLVNQDARNKISNYSIWFQTQYVKCAPKSSPQVIKFRWAHATPVEDFAYSHLLKLEGGYSNDPDDSEGATMKGITIRIWTTYSQELFGIEPSIETLKAITDDQVWKIFQVEYWKRSNAYRINNSDIAIQYVDFFFNSWSGGFIVLQRTINALVSESENRVVEDGIVGTGTVRAVNRLIELGMVPEVYRKFRELRILHYRSIVRKKPSQAKWLNGWINRANSFQEY